MFYRKLQPVQEREQEFMIQMAEKEGSILEKDIQIQTLKASIAQLEANIAE